MDSPQGNFFPFFLRKVIYFLAEKPLRHFNSGKTVRSISSVLYKSHKKFNESLTQFRTKKS